MNDEYFAALAADEDLGRTRGVDATLKQFKLDAILLPTNGMLCIRWSGLHYGFTFTLGFTTEPAAIAGYPVVTGVSTDKLYHQILC